MIGAGVAGDPLTQARSVDALQKVARYLYRTLQQLGFGSLGQGAATSSGGSGGDNTAVDELVAFRDAVRKVGAPLRCAARLAAPDHTMSFVAGGTGGSNTRHTGRVQSRA